MLHTHTHMYIDMYMTNYNLTGTHYFSSFSILDKFVNEACIIRIYEHTKCKMCQYDNILNTKSIQN